MDRRRITQGIILFILILGSLALFGLGILTSPYIAVLGGYVPLALILMSVIHSNVSIGDWELWSVQPRILMKSFGATYLLGIAVLAQWGDPAPIAAVSFLLAVQLVALWNVTKRKSIVLMAGVMLFSVTPLTVYLTTGLFFGNGDTLVHLQSVDILIESGDITEMPLERYHTTPGLHYLVAGAALVVGVGPYHVLIASGVLGYGTAVLLIALMARSLFGWRIAIGSLFAGIAVTPMTFYSLYFFPQSLTVVMLIGLLFIGFRRNHHKRHAFHAAAVAFSVAAVFAHALAMFLFMGLMMLLYVGATIVDDSRGVPPGVLIWTPIMAAVTHWTYIHIGFTRQITGAILLTGSKLLDSPLYDVGSGGGATLKTALGMSYPAIGVNDAVAWFGTPQAIYYTCFAAIAGMAIAYVFEHTQRFQGRYSLLALGVGGLLLLLKTPFFFTSKIRVALMFVPFTATLVGVGISYIDRLDRGVFSARTLGVLAVIGLIVSGPIVGVFSTELTGYSSPDSYSKAETAQMRSTAEFVSRHGPVSAAHTEQIYLEYLGVESSSINVTRGEIRSGRLFLYRDRMWRFRQTHSVKDRLAQGSFLVSRSWQQAAENQNNKVYSSGSIKILNPNNGTIDPTYE